MNAYIDKVAETERVKQRKRARVERGAADVPVEPRNRTDEQVAVRHADASGSAGSDQHVKKLMSLREGFHVMMQCYVRHHFPDRNWLHEHPKGHASRREHTMRKFSKESTSCIWNIQKLQSGSAQYVRKTTGFFTNSGRIKIALESYFEEHAQEVWERNWMSPEMQTTLLNTYTPKLIATILKALREELKESDQLLSVGGLQDQYQKSLLSMIKS